MSSNTTTTDNLSLWNAVCKTNPEHTRGVSKGKRKFTAICPQYQIKSATEQFGPYGAGWGLKNIERDFNSLKDYELAIFSGVFWFPGGEFEISTSMPIWISKQKGMLDNDICKKAETDLLTKALSKIGFNADVFEGKFDDNRYVAEMQAEFSKPQTVTALQLKTLQELMPRDHTVSDFCKQWSLGSLEELWASNFDEAVKWINEQEMKRRDFIEAGRKAEKKRIQQEKVDQFKKDNAKKVIMPSQVKTIHSYIESIDAMSEVAFCRKAGIGTIGQLIQERYEGALAWLEGLLEKQEHIKAHADEGQIQQFHQEYDQADYHQQQPVKTAQEKHEEYSNIAASVVQAHNERNAHRARFNTDTRRNHDQGHQQQNDQPMSQYQKRTAMMDRMSNAA